jgi:hypothetical protein
LTVVDTTIDLFQHRHQHEGIHSNANYPAWQTLNIVRKYFLNVLQHFFNMKVENDDWANLQISTKGQPVENPVKELHEAHSYAETENNLIFVREYELSFNCPYDLKSYPFDSQSCPLDKEAS